MNISEYIAQFNEKDVVNVFSELVKAEVPYGYLADREVDILDVELFFDRFCVGVGEEGIADLIVEEYNERAKHFDCILNNEAKFMALAALRQHFFYNGYTLLKGDSLFASAFDWLNENYKLMEIPFVNMDGEQPMVLAFDFDNAKSDVDHFINHNWYLWNGEIKHILEIAKKRIENKLNDIENKLNDF